MGLPGGERSLTISSAMRIEYTDMTDGRTPADSKDRAYAWCRVLKTVKHMSYTDWGLFSRSLHCYKHDICISRIVTQNTLKCAISRAKFQDFSGDSPDPTPLPSHASPPHGLWPLAPLSRNPGSATVSIVLQHLEFLVLIC